MNSQKPEQPDAITASERALSMAGTHPDAPAMPASRVRFEAALKTSIDWVFEGLPAPSETMRSQVAAFLVNPKTMDSKTFDANRVKALARRTLGFNGELGPEQRRQLEFMSDKLMTVAQGRLPALYQRAVDDVGSPFIAPANVITDGVIAMQKQLGQRGALKR